MSYRVDFELIGTMPLLMHWDNIEGADQLEAWRKAPANKNKSRPGDDRSPPWTWQLYMYNDGEHVAIPQDNVMSALKYGGGQVPPWWKTAKKSARELTQTAILIGSEFLEFEYDKKRRLALSQLAAIRELSFAEQSEAVVKMGFRLHVKRAKVGNAKHVRVRARFDTWSVRGALNVMSDDLPLEKLEEIFIYAGRGGLCDWRPSSPKSPGPYGMFEVKFKK